MPGFVIPLVGTTNSNHIAECVKAVDIVLNRDYWYELLVIARGRSIPEKNPLVNLSISKSK